MVQEMYFTFKTEFDCTLVSFHHSKGKEEFIVTYSEGDFKSKSVKMNVYELLHSVHLVWNHRKLVSNLKFSELSVKPYENSFDFAVCFEEKLSIGCIKLELNGTALYFQKEMLVDILESFANH